MGVEGIYNPYSEDAYEKYGEGYSEKDVKGVLGIGDEPVLMGLKTPNMGGVISIPKEDIKVSEMKAESASATAPASVQIVEDPYKRTNEAIANANKSWRQMLLDNYEKRQAENKKRVRSAQIVGLGKALGDLVAGIWGGAASLKNNAPAIVPAMQSSKTSEEIEKLINEGVVNTKDYDTMLLNLAMQEEKDKIALAKAYDELGVKQRQSEVAHEREMQKINTRGSWQQILAALKSNLQAARDAKKAENAENLAKIKGQIAKQVKELGGVGNLDWFTYESLQELFPGEVEFTTTTTSPDKYGQPQTKTVSGTRKMPQGAAQAKMTAQENERFAKSVGLKKEEVEHITTLRTLITEGRFTQEQMKQLISQARKEGKSIAELIELLNPKK